MPVKSNPVFSGEHSYKKKAEGKEEKQKGMIKKILKRKVVNLPRKRELMPKINLAIYEIV